MKLPTMMALALSMLSVAVRSHADVLFNGRWEGTIIVTPAEQEMDVILNVTAGQDGRQGKLRFPLSNPKEYEMKDINVSSRQVSFMVQDEDGVVSKFEGEIDSTGSKINGKMTENNKELPFSLQHVSTPASTGEPELQKLSQDAVELRTIFNRDAGHKRILMILNPGSYSSRMALRIVKRYTLDQGIDPNLRLYVIWVIPEKNLISDQIARQSAALAVDDRISHFVGDDATVSGIFRPVLSAYGKVSNPSMLYSTKKTWANTVPAPDRLLQAPKVGAPPITGEKLNGLNMTFDLKSLE
jgi:hypothetical protein